MSVTQVTGLVQGALAKGGGFFVEGDASYSRTLTIGQILKARILRHYEGGRYLADIDGRQKVVDSAIPLRVGEIVHGRVAALGERVHLQRVAGDRSAQQSKIPAQRSLFGGAGQQLEELFARYEASLSPTDRAELLRQTGRASKPQLMALGGLVLSKLGTDIAPEFLRAVYRVLNTTKLQEMVRDLDSPHHLAVEATPVQTRSDDVVQQLAGILESAHLDTWRRYGVTRSEEVEGNQTEDTEPHISEGDRRAETGSRQNWSGPYSEWLLGQRLLNTQSEGSVNHRLSHFPLWFGERLVEVSVALFSQQEASCGEEGIRHRRLVLSLETSHLGHLEVTVNLADHHLRLRLTTGDEAATERLARHLSELKTVLEANGWEIDEIDYVTEAQDETGAVLQSVVDHHISQNSLSRLM